MDTVDRAQEYIEKFTDQAIARAAKRPPEVERAIEAVDCSKCGDPIPIERLKAVPGVSLCTGCQAKRELRQNRYR